MLLSTAKIAKEIEIMKKKCIFANANKTKQNEKDSYSRHSCSDDDRRHGARLLLKGKERNEKRLLFQVKRNQTMQKHENFSDLLLGLGRDPQRR